eukprot:m.217115 g.217115  ORF g.217115 m.217115 type:complete len:102 (+) comp15553_c0_seq10:306-611(+)
MRSASTMPSHPPLPLLLVCVEFPPQMHGECKLVGWLEVGCLTVADSGCVVCSPSSHDEQSVQPPFFFCVVFVWSQFWRGSLVFQPAAASSVCADAMCVRGE